MTEPVLWALAAGLALAALGWGGGRLLRLAILRGLRAPRVRPAWPLDAGSGPEGPLRGLFLNNPQGKRLAAWVAWPSAAVQAPVPAVLVMHGWGANASMMAPVVAPLQAAGLAVLLVDARCHGDSDDEPFTSMPRFAADIATGLTWLRSQPGIDGRRIALLGHSVGAAAALLHAAGAPGQPGDQRIGAVVSLSAFAHPQEVMRRLLAEVGLPYPVLGWAVLQQVQRMIGARFDDIAPLHTLPRVRCPVLLVHGLDDRTVPFSDAQRLLRVAPQGELLAVSGDHDLRDALAPQLGRIVGFLQRALRTEPQPAAAAGEGPSGRTALAVLVG